MEKREGVTERAARWICVALLALGVYLLLKYAAGIFIPFLIAFGIGAAIYPLSVKTNKRTHIPQRLCAVVYVLLFVALLCVIAYFSLRRLYGELLSFTERMGDGGESVAVEDMLFGLLDRIPLLRGFGGYLRGAAQKAAEGIGARIGESIGRLVAAAPEAIFTFIVTLMAAIYFAADFARLRDGMISLLPEGAAQRVRTVRVRIGEAARAYARAYLLLFLLTFAEVFFGLLILRRQYAFLAALLIALVDILPVFGAGTVLVPWAVIRLLGGDTGIGCGLLVLYGVVTVVRQIAEPHVVGARLGVHPLASLFCTFACLKLFGVIGVLMGPAVAMLAREAAKINAELGIRN